ncbi:MAG: endonuclease [Flavicella sp.]
MRKITFLLCLFTISLYAQVPSYYNDVDYTKTGLALFDELSEKLDRTHNGLPYSSSSTDSWDVLNESDEDPSIASNVLLIYGYDDNDQDDANDRTRAESYCCGNVWNREHVYPQSIAKPGFSTTNVGPGTDIHNLKPCDPGYNSSRSNRKYTDSSGNSGKVGSYWYPGDEWKGDIARIIMYMYVRYNGNGSSIAEQQCLPKSIGVGNATTIDANMVDLFLKWNAEDPVDAFEANRNEVIFAYQKNRNPFIDNPYLATAIWGGNLAEDKWNLSGGSDDTEAPSAPTNIIVSEITDEAAKITWTAATDNVAVYEYMVYANDVLLKSTTATSVDINGLDSSTTYEIKVKAKDAAANTSAFSNGVSFTTLKGYTTILHEDFNTLDNVATFDILGENFAWEIRDNGQYGDEVFAQMSAYPNEVSEDWIVSSEIDLTDVTNTTFQMSQYINYTDGVMDAQKVLVSSDYNGNVATATWTEILLSTRPAGNNHDFVTSEKYDLSAFDGKKVHIGFKYIGTNDNGSRWRIDSFTVTAMQNGTASINTILEESFYVYPNPISGDFLQIASSFEGEIALYNILGAQILPFKNYPNATINVSNLQKGMYILVGKNGTTIVKKKLIVQ